MSCSNALPVELVRKKKKIRIAHTASQLSQGKKKMRFLYVLNLFLSDFVYRRTYLTINVLEAA